MAWIEGSSSACIRISGLAVTTNSRLPPSMASPAFWQNSSAVPGNTRRKYSLMAIGSPFLFRFPIRGNAAILGRSGGLPVAFPVLVKVEQFLGTERLGTLGRL